MKKPLIIFLISIFSFFGVGYGDVSGGNSAFKYIGKDDYTSQNPNLGYSYRYEAENAWADEYHYFKVNDGNFAVVNGHFNSILESFKLAVQRKIYKNLEVIERGERTIDGVKFLYAKLLITQNGGKVEESYLYLTIFNGEFLKYRFTSGKPMRRDGAARQQESSAKKQLTVEEVEGFIKLRLAKLKKV